MNHNDALQKFNFFLLCVNSTETKSPICYLIYIPHILSGASSSSKIGCDKNISRDFKHNPRISDSVSCTFFPGLEPRTKRKWRKEK